MTDTQEDWQVRLVAEYEELAHRQIKLDQFINKAPFDALDIEDRTLMLRQQSLMTQLSRVLKERIERFT